MSGDPASLVASVLAALGRHDFPAVELLRGEVIYANSAALKLAHRYGTDFLALAAQRQLEQADSVEHEEQALVVRVGLSHSTREVYLETTRVALGAEHWLMLCRDVTSEMETGDRIHQVSLQDPVTGLANRPLFNDRLENSLKLSIRRKKPLTVVLLDLAGFGAINHSFGHAVGDQLLKEAGHRLRSQLRQTDTVARLGADQFGLILPDADAAGGRQVADKLLRALEVPFLVQGESLEVGGKIGMACYPDHGAEEQLLLRRADIAVHNAKRTGEKCVCYASGFERNETQELLLLAALRSALEKGELGVNYQPIVSLPTNSVVGVESLARWKHPTLGFINPMTFISIAERHGLIHALTRYMLKASLAQCERWLKQGIALRVSVNLSPRNLVEPTFVESVRQAVEASRVPTSLLGLEVTESVLVSNPDHVASVLGELRRLGIHIAIDDFGTGYSSLSYLRKLPVDTLKIDRSFIVDMAQDVTNATIVRATIELAHSVSLQTVAEGVETEELVERLRSLGCDSVQGYFFAKPMSGEDLPQWLAEFKRKHLERGQPAAS